MNINALLDLIDDTLYEARVVPMTNGKRLVDTEALREYVEELRRNLPEELRQAQGIVNDRAQILEEANTHSNLLIKRAEERARAITSEQEIVKQAQVRANEIVAKAQEDAKEVRQTVTSYCENMLKATEKTMRNNAMQVKTVCDNLRKNAKDSVQ